MMGEYIGLMNDRGYDTLAKLTKQGTRDRGDLGKDTDNFCPLSYVYQDACYISADCAFAAECGPVALGVLLCANPSVTVLVCATCAIGPRTATRPYLSATITVHSTCHIIIFIFLPTLFRFCGSAFSETRRDERGSRCLVTQK